MYNLTTNYACKLMKFEHMAKLHHKSPNLMKNCINNRNNNYLYILLKCSTKWLATVYPMERDTK